MTSGWRELREWLPNNLSSVPALFGLAGLLAYGALNVASTIFYQGFGITPSAVGLGYAELLARVAVIVAIVAATALVCALVVGGVVHVLVVPWAGAPDDPDRAWLKLLAAGVAAILLCDLVLSVPPPLSLQLSWADVFALVVLDVLVAILVLILVVFLEKPLARRCGIQLHHVLVAGGVWLLIAPLSFVAHAVEGSRQVQAGQRQRESLFGAPFPWQVAVADVTWKEPRSRPPRTPRCLLYLGSTDGVAVFYDSTSEDRRSLQVPSADVIVEIFPEKASC